MLRKLGKMGALLLSLASAGCQGFFLTEHYNDAVDHVNDCPFRMDWAYFPKLDLTRINRADGIQCRHVPHKLRHCDCPYCVPY